MPIASTREQWEHLISRSFVPLRLDRAASAFSGSVEQTVLAEDVTLTDVRTRGHSVVVRSPSLVRSGPNDGFLFSLHLHGAGTLVQGEREAVLVAGAGAVYDTARPYRLTFPGDTRELVLGVPRQALRERGGDTDELSGRPVRAGDPAARVLSAFLQELAATVPSMPRDALPELGWTAVDLLALALRTAPAHAASTASLDARQAKAREARLAAAREHVARHYPDPDLTAARLARATGVSPRYLTGLFAEHGTSPSECIRDRRLEAARAALVDPRLGTRTVAAIAAQCGFSDRTTFTRAFSRRYGVTPGGFRSQG